MFTVTILVCSINLAPMDCQMNTARDVVSGPEAVNEMSCGFQGQAFMATMRAIALKPDEYLKIMCTRTSIGKIIG